MTTKYDGIVRFERLFNFRDLSTATGHILYNRVMRCANPIMASEKDAAILLNSFNVKTLVDLRDPEEAGTVDDFANLLNNFITVDAELSIPNGNFRTRRFLGNGISQVSQRPEMKEMNDRIQKVKREQGQEAAMMEVDMGFFMIVLIDTQPNLFRKALTLISRKENHPCLFFCSAGRDRTGCLSMLILKICGATDDEIVQDYLKSTCLASVENVYSKYKFGMSKKQHAYFEKNGFGDADIDENEIDYDELDAAMDTFLLRLNPKDIMDTMNHIKTKYGSFNAYFDSIGFYENDRQRLKTALSIYNSSSL